METNEKLTNEIRFIFSSMRENTLQLGEKSIPNMYPKDWSLFCKTLVSHNSIEKIFLGATELNALSFDCLKELFQTINITKI